MHRGFANALYRFHKLAKKAPIEFVGTKDLDMGVPQRLELAHRPPVAQLMNELDFKERIHGDSEDAIVKYGPKDENIPVDLEFLCGKSGLSTKDQERAAYAVQEGLYAQPLRYLEISFNNAWEVSLEHVPGLERLSDIAIKVPNPAANVVSRILVRKERRPPASMNKDCFYIYEASLVFRDALDAIRAEYDRLTPCTPRWKKRFAKDARLLFGSDNSEGPISAVQVYHDIGAQGGDGLELSEEMVCRSVSRMLDAMLE